MKNEVSWLLVFVLVLTNSVGCGGEEGARGPAARAGAGGAAGAATAGTDTGGTIEGGVSAVAGAGGTATVAGAGGVSAVAGAGGVSAVAGAGGAAGGGLEAPDSEQALLPFLETKQYAGWAKEAEHHQSSGPHGDGVRVYYSPKAAEALRSGAETFPAGAASVKELTSGGSLYGYAVWVKVEEASDGGNGFYWYEIIHQGGGKSSVYGNARGSADCTTCHSAGKDYCLSTLPFE